MVRIKTAQPLPVVTMMPIRDVIQLLIAGAITGLVTAALYALFNKYVFDPAFCHNGAALPATCANKVGFSSAAAMIVSGFGALFVLVRLRVFRPLLVIIFVTLALWNIMLQIDSLPWYGITTLSAILFGLAYAAFAWLVQIRNLYSAFGLGAVLVVVLRVALTS